MNLIEDNIQSFVVRIWYEPISELQPDGEWRGHVTDVASFERRYFRGVDALTSFIESRLNRINADADDPADERTRPPAIASGEMERRKNPT